MSSIQVCILLKVCSSKFKESWKSPWAPCTTPNTFTQTNLHTCMHIYLYICKICKRIYMEQLPQTSVRNNHKMVL